jgi:hypothetical protein
MPQISACSAAGTHHTQKPMPYADPCGKLPLSQICPSAPTTRASATTGSSTRSTTTASSAAANGRCHAALSKRSLVVITVCSTSPQATAMQSGNQSGSRPIMTRKRA